MYIGGVVAAVQRYNTKIVITTEAILLGCKKPPPGFTSNRVRNIFLLFIARALRFNSLQYKNIMHQRIFDYFFVWLKIDFDIDFKYRYKIVKKFREICTFMYPYIM